MIKEIYINNFGKFNNYSLTFDKGINVLVGNNEAGKTTIIAFISMVLYGNQTKSTDLLQNERRKYQPWDGSQMKGHLIITKEGIDYRVERIFNKSNSTDIVKVLNNHTGQEIDIIDNKEPGKYFLGMDLDSFKKTLYISSEDLVISNDDKKDEITKRLINLVTTGEEDLSYISTLKNLDRKIEEGISKSGKKGTIVDLRQEIDEIKSLMESARQDELEKSKIDLQIKNKEEDYKAQTIKINNLKTALKRKDDKDEMSRKKEDIKGKIVIKESSPELERLGLLRESIIQKENENSFIRLKPLDISLLLAIGSLFLLSVNTYLAISLAIIFLMAFLYSQKTKIDDKNRELKSMYKKEEVLEDFAKKQERMILDLNNEIFYIDKAIDEINYEVKNLGLINKDLAYSNLQILQEEAYQIRQDIVKIESMAKAKFSGKENYATLEHLLTEKSRQLEYLEEKHDLFVKTKDLLVKSFGQVEVDFSDQLSKVASEYIFKITHGKYEKLVISNEFDIKVLDRQSNDLIDWKYVSAGTIDQLYLSLRLAIIELLVENREAKILLLDDLFMRFDRKRQENTISIFLEIAKDFEQIICFSNKLPIIEENNNVIYI